MTQKLEPQKKSILNTVIRFCLENKLVVVLVVLIIVGWGIMSAPFDWDTGDLPRQPVPVDAIPDIGENQQIVFTQWMGRSPQDVEDQITYPLTASLLGVPGVKTIRSNSYFGFSTIYIIFNEDVEFYWSRSRILEKLNSLAPGTLPQGVQPVLGPDATALGQVFWYTLEGQDPDGNPAGGWGLEELRTVQDWYVRYGLMRADGVAEVASVGGFVEEYQIDVDPDAMRASHVKLDEVFMAVKNSNVDVGARNIEINKVDYVIRGLGFIKNITDIENTVIKVSDNVPIYVKDVATVSKGPALRRGALVRGGAEAVGGVVVVRYGFNPLAAIKSVKEKIAEISPGLPEKPVVDYDKVTREEVIAFATSRGFGAYTGDSLAEDAWLVWLKSNPRSSRPEWITTSRVTIVPFYDRTGLIHETLGTLDAALLAEIFVTIIVVMISLMHLRSSILISSSLPLAVLMCFIAMRMFGVDANIVALSGIAIAIGTIVDMSIVVCENILRHLEKASPVKSRLEVVYRATKEVGSAVMTAVATTVISFLPVFTMIGPEGKLFKPLAFTKTFALVASIIIALFIVPAGALVLFTGKFRTGRIKKWAMAGLFIAGVLLIPLFGWWWAGIVIMILSGYFFFSDHLPHKARKIASYVANGAAVIIVLVMLTNHWQPLGPAQGLMKNLLLVGILIGVIMGIFTVFRFFYGRILHFFLRHKITFLVIPVVLTVVGAMVWLGFDHVFFFIPHGAGAVGIPEQKVRQTTFWLGASKTFPGLGKEFMPPLDEGSFLLMPTTMPHASIGEAVDILEKQDRALRAIPEIDTVVGKVGRVDSPLDPAPVSMIETVINYKSEYITDKDGRRINFRYDTGRGVYVRDEKGSLIPDPSGRPYRQWRANIKSPDDIWEEIVAATHVLGTTSAPKLQPIAARLVMLQSGMRAPLGVKVRGPDLQTIEGVSLQIEKFLKEVPSVDARTVIADRIVGKPYLEINIDREAIARYGLSIRKVQDVIETAIGGRSITTTVEGRRRYGVRVRYHRELRDQIESMERVLVAAADGTQVPLEQVATIEYVRGPMVIKSEDTFLVGYVVFDKKGGTAEVDVVEDCKRFLEQKEADGAFLLPAGVSYTFAGTYENQIRARRTLSIVLPVALFIILLILYFQFRSISTTLIVFSGIIVAWAGGFILIWMYGQSWFMNFSLFGMDMRELFQIHSINLSVAVWVGFLALFGIASDNGVVIATYLRQSFASREIEDVKHVREATVEGAVRRIRPCLMTSATTILALLPVLTSTGRGSDIMVPMAIPSFGGMLVVLVSVFVVPVLYSMAAEVKLKMRLGRERKKENRK